VHLLLDGPDVVQSLIGKPVQVQAVFDKLKEEPTVPSFRQLVAPSPASAPMGKAQKKVKEAAGLTLGHVATAAPLVGTLQSRQLSLG
jgi:hypothetical protein